MTPEGLAADQDANLHLRPETATASVTPEPPALLPKQRGRYAQEPFGAPRSLAVATNQDLITELQRRMKDDPRLAELFRLIIRFPATQEPLERGLSDGLQKHD
jgi:hypothetical protein